MPGDRRRRQAGAIRMGMLLGLVVAGLVAAVVTGMRYTSNQAVRRIFDQSASDSHDLAVETVSRFAELLASNTAITVQPSVLDHAYSYIRPVLSELTRRDRNLLYVGVFDADGKLVDESGSRAGAATAVQASAAITSQGDPVGRVDVLYSTAAVDDRIEKAKQASEERRSSAMNTLLVEGVVVLGLGLLFAVVFGVWLSRPVARLAGAAETLGEGKFDVRVAVAGPTELRQLAHTFNAMAGELQTSVEASIERGALDREVATARRLQREMMPPEQRMVVGRFEIASWYEPTGKMGGDWWTLTEPADGAPLTVMIGDVMGHGIPAALFTAAAKSAYRTAGVLDRGSGPDRLLATVDAALRDFSQSHTMTCAALQLDAAADRMVLALAAHPPPLRFRRGASGAAMDVLEADGPLLGDPEPTGTFTSVEHAFAAGDLLVLYTDGLVEATDGRERMYGLRRLRAAIGGHLAADLDVILDALKQDFAAHVAGREVDDDVTVVLVRHLPDGSDK